MFSDSSRWNNPSSSALSDLLLIKQTQCYIAKVYYKRYSPKLDDSVSFKTFLREEMGKVAGDIAKDGCAHGVLYSQIAFRLLTRLIVVLRDLQNAVLFVDKLFL